MADSDTGSGETVINSFSIAYDFSLGTVFYTWGANFEAVFEYDLFTGDRVVVSK